MTLKAAITMGHGVGGALALILSGGCLQAAGALEGPVPAITVQGEAVADVAPDTARLAIGVAVERPTATAAMTVLAQNARTMTDAVVAEGIDRKDVMTTALELVPLYADHSDATVPLSPRAFRAATTIRITVRPPERVGALASDLVAKGANTIDAIEYSASQVEGRLDTLRADAMRDARRKADIYVGSLGLHLGRVLDIAPDSFDGARPPPVIMRAAAPSAPKASVPSAPGTLTLRAAVTVRWAIDQ